MTVASPHYLRGACTWHLRQHEDRSRRRVCRQGAPVQPALSPDVRPLHLVEPTACTPAAGWEKGEVENQVGLVRERFFTPRLRFEKLRGDERLAAHRPLRRPCQGPSPSGCGTGRLWSVFEPTPRAGALRRPVRWLPQHAGGGLEDLPGALRQQQVLGPARAVGRPVEIQAYAGRIMVRQDGEVVARHAAGSAATRPSTIPGATFPSWPASQGLSGAGHRSGTGFCRAPWGGCAPGSPPRPTATARWWTFSARC